MKQKSLLAVVLAVVALLLKLVLGGDGAAVDSSTSNSSTTVEREAPAPTRTEGSTATQPSAKSSKSAPSNSKTAEKLGPSSKELYAAIREQRSNQWVEGSALVVKLLPDDDEGSRHQKFLAELDDGSTLLFSHNIDLAPRASVDKGDVLTFRGRYEWNEKGGVVHWTHHDPDDPTRGGWLKVDGDVFQ
ncbi:MAG: DUF3465 domain-containing protein [Planctomycetes bacterium]|nr:DUF3465 domain-containing protein [Planctomycetota bacterium]